jgi:antitoxin ParD1/3/4
MTMNVSLSPQLEAMVKDKVASGRYTSASEVVREALRLMEQRDQLSAMRLQQLEQDIQDGLASGEPLPWNPEAIKSGGRRRLEARSDSTLSD